jgi:hypothetical protein
MEENKERHIDNSWRAKMVEKGLYKDSEITSEEKQIEEMAKLIKDYCIIDASYGGKPYANDYENLARILLEHYQPKLPEDSFVLTNDNAEELANLIVTSPQMQSVMSDLIKAWQKETAEKIYCELQGHGTTYVKKWIKDTYGVEIKE